MSNFTVILSGSEESKDSSVATLPQNDERRFSPLK